MTAERTIDAAGQQARQESDLRIEIAQGDAPKLEELVVNRGLVPGDLSGWFQVAANAVMAEHHTQDMELFFAQQEQTVQQAQQEQEKQDKERAEDAWLESMSPEYREAYSGLMNTVDDAKRQYDDMSQKLIAQRQQLDQDAKDIDDKALHLKNGSRAYVNGNGELVDKDGKALDAKKKKEAMDLWNQMGRPQIANYNAYADNQGRIAKNQNDQNLVADGKAQAEGTGTKAHDHGYKTPEELKTAGGAVTTKLTTTSTKVLGDLEDKNSAELPPKTSNVSYDAFGVDDDTPAPASQSSADRGSLSHNLDQSGIAGQSISQPFNASAQPTAVAPATAPLPTQKPSVATPAPSV